MLQQTVGNLRNENKSLKNQISRGIQSIQSYNHNLPCDRQKQLENKLTKVSQQLTQETEMRLNLQKSIDSIIMNFKRLYDEADAARLIVTQKLRDVEERERKLKSLEMEQQKSMIISVSKSNQEKDIPNFLSLNSRENTSSLRRQFQTDLKTTENKNKPNKYSTTRQKDQRSVSGISDQSSSLTMEQKIKRMKANQAKLGNVFKH